VDNTWDEMLKFRYKSVDISNFGPFGPNNILYLENGTCFVEGDHGRGKTTIAHALLGYPAPSPPNLSALGVNRHRPPNAEKILEGTDEHIEKFLLHCPEDYMKPHELLKLSFSKGLIKAEQIPTFANLVSDNLNQMLARKYSEFQLWFQVDANEQFKPEVFLRRGKNWVGTWAPAVEENTVLSLAIYHGIRKINHPAIDVPFVIDCIFGRLSLDVRDKVLDFLPSLSSQLIVLEQCSFFSLTGVKPDFIIEQDGSRDSPSRIVRPTA
jgi:hypothetical protein